MKGDIAKCIGMLERVNFLKYSMTNWRTVQRHIRPSGCTGWSEYTLVTIALRLVFTARRFEPRISHTNRSDIRDTVCTVFSDPNVNNISKVSWMHFYLFTNSDPNIIDITKAFRMGFWLVRKRCIPRWHCTNTLVDLALHW